MDSVIIAFLLGAVIGGLLTIVAIVPRSPPPVPAPPLDVGAMLQQQLQAVQLQNMLRGAQLEQERQQAELLALRQQRDGIARLNHSDVQAALSYIGQSQGGYVA